MAAGRQATGNIISDVGSIYKRLLNHRPVIQNEVHFFLKEFEVKREDIGLKSLQDSMKYANEMDTILLEEIMNSSHKFKQINAIIETINGTGGQIFDDENTNLSIPKSEQEVLDRSVEEFKQTHHKKQEAYDIELSKHASLLKEEIQSEREGRDKLRPPSQTTSVGSSVTIFPSEVQLSPGDSEDSPVDQEAEETVPVNQGASTADETEPVNQGGSTEETVRVNQGGGTEETAPVNQRGSTEETEPVNQGGSTEETVEKIVDHNQDTVADNT